MSGAPVLVVLSQTLNGGTAGRWKYMHPLAEAAVPGNPAILRRNDTNTIIADGDAKRRGNVQFTDTRHEFQDASIADQLVARLFYPSAFRPDATERDGSAAGSAVGMLAAPSVAVHLAAVHTAAGRP